MLLTAFLCTTGARFTDLKTKEIRGTSPAVMEPRLLAPLGLSLVARAVPGRCMCQRLAGGIDLMKPHFRKLNGVWHCGIKGIPNKRIGVGYTPKAAYLDWLGVGHG